MRARGIPMVGVGLQPPRPPPGNPPPYYPTQPQVTKVLQTLAANGFQSELTELDQPLSLPANKRELRLQSMLYMQMVSACLAVAKCSGVTVWGLDDNDRYQQLRDRNLGAATLFAGGGRVKPAYNGVSKALRTAPGPPAGSRASPGYTA